jgi:hypothetical protein
MGLHPWRACAATSCCARCMIHHHRAPSLLLTATTDNGPAQPDGTFRLFRRRRCSCRRCRRQLDHDCTHPLHHPPCATSLPHPPPSLMWTQALRNSMTCWFATLLGTAHFSWAAQPPLPIFTCGRCVTRCCLRCCCCCCCCCFQRTPSVQPACFILQSGQSSPQTRGYRRLPPEV